MSTLLTIYVWFSILVLATLILIIFQSVATIKRKYPDYHGKKVSKIELIFSIFKMIIISFIPLFNILVFWVTIFHTNEVVNTMVEKVIKGEY